MTVKTEAVKFYDTIINTYEIDGKKYVSVNQICESLGIDARTQKRKIDTDTELSVGKVIRPLLTTGGTQDTTLLALDYLQGWLFTITTSKVKPEMQERIRLYRRECFQALHNYFTQGYAHNHSILSKDSSKVEAAIADLQLYRRATNNNFRSMLDMLDSSLANFRQWTPKYKNPVAAHLRNLIYEKALGLSTTEIIKRGGVQTNSGINTQYKEVRKAIDYLTPEEFNKVNQVTSELTQLLLTSNVKFIKAKELYKWVSSNLPKLEKVS